MNLRVQHVSPCSPGSALTHVWTDFTVIQKSFSLSKRADMTRKLLLDQHSNQSSPASHGGRRSPEELWPHTSQPKL